MKGDVLHIYLRPEDFDSKYYSPLKQALFRLHYKTVAVPNSQEVYIKGKHYLIENEFDYYDFLYVKDQYRLDPKMKKAEYYVTLIEQ